MSAADFNQTQSLSTNDWWSDKYQELLDELNSMNNAGNQILFVMSVLLPFISNDTENDIGKEADIMNAVNALNTDLNTIQAAFDNCDGAPDYNEAAKAVDAANDILIKLEGKDPNFDASVFSSIKGDIINQVQTLFDFKDHSDYWDLSDPNNPTIKDTDKMTHSIAGIWNQAWASTTDPSVSRDSTTPFINAFDAISTQFNGQSSTAQSMAQYLQSNDQQYLGIMQTIMDNWIKQEEAPIQGSKTT